MPRRGRREQLAPNVFRDASGVAVKVTVSGRTRERRFPAGTPLEQLLEERDRLKGQQQAARPAKRGTLHADVVAYLQAIADARKRKGQQILCAHWVAAYGELSRFALTPLVIRQQLATWHRGGAAASTCNHRLSTLRAIFRTLNAEDEPNYPAQVRKLPEPHPQPRALDYRTITRILAAMPDRGRPTGKGKGTRPTVSLTKLRCALMAYTGLPPAQIAQINPETDIAWDAPALRVRPRRKGKGTPEQWIPLLPQAVAVLRALAAAKGFTGRYSNDSVAASWQRACRKVIAEQLAAGETPLPHRVLEDGTIRPLVRVYDLRHSFASQALASRGNLEAVKRLMLHSDARQTARYILAAVPAAAAETARALAEALPTWGGSTGR